MDPIAQFREALSCRGIIAPSEIIADGRIHRCDAEVKNGKGDAAYLLHLNGVPAGGFENWHDGLGWESWRADLGRTLLPAEEAAYRAKIEAARREREAEDAKRRVEARKRSAAIWKAAQPARDAHPYLKRKGVKAYGLRLHQGALVIPLRDASGELHSLQFIGADGDKKFLTGGRVAGCYLGIGEPNGALCIAEGYATGASIFEATGYAVVVAFNAGNLAAVARALRGKFPEARLILCADDDYRTDGNPGIAKATEAARAVGGLLAVPDFGADRPDGATDFNDLARERGAEAVAACIANATASARAEPRPAAKNAPQVSIITAEGTPRPQATVLIDIGRTHTLFHDHGGDAYAQLRNGGVCAIGSGEYREVLGGEFYKLTGRGANRNALADAVTTLAAIAKHEGDAAQVFLRVGKSDGGIVIDTGRQDRACHVVNADAWRTVETPPVHFRRSGKPLPLPEPAKPDFGLLWRYVNVRKEDRVLIAAWLLAALRPRGPYPILVLIGEQGSGKSSTARAIKSLTDPSASPLRAPPRDVRDLLVAALSSWVLALDNMSGADPQLSDALCRLSTGGALSERTYFTNSEETLIEVQRPVILNGIDDLATRPDLADRCIPLELPQLERVAAEEDLNDGFRRDAGAIFAALLDGLRRALRDARALDIGKLPRMADFAKWAAAGVPALGFTAKAFLAAYRANQAGAIEAGLDSSAVGQAVRAFMAHQATWTGPASSLLRDLAVGTDTTARSWPRSPKGLLNALRRLAPSLRHVGITWHHDRSATQRTITLCKGAGHPSEASQASRPNDGMTFMTHDCPPCTGGAVEVEV